MSRARTTKVVSIHVGPAAGEEFPFFLLFSSTFVTEKENYVSATFGGV